MEYSIQIIEMLRNGFVAKEEPSTAKPSKKRSARQANMDTTIPIETKRTRRQEAIFLAEHSKI